MATDDKEQERAIIEAERGRALAMFEVLDALHEVAKAELAKGPGLASNAWSRVANAIAPLLGHEPIGKASPVAEHQPVVMPPGFENPIPPKGGAVPIVRPELVNDIRQRPDVAAELERINKGQR